MNIYKILDEFNCTIDDVKEIYYGGDRCCRCGCKGKYAKAGTPLFKRYLTKIAKTKLAKGSNISYAKRLSKPDWINLPIDTSTMIGKCYCLYLT